MDPERSLYARIKKMANLLDREVARRNIVNKLDAEKVTSPLQGRIIFYLYSRGGKGEVFQKELEKHFDIRASTAAVILKRMEANKLITREINPADERTKTVKLTAKALDIYPKALAGLRKTDKHLTRGLTARDMEIFNKVLDKITENISAD